MLTAHQLLAIRRLLPEIVSASGSGSGHHWTYLEHRDGSLVLIFRLAGQRRCRRIMRTGAGPMIGRVPEEMQARLVQIFGPLAFDE